MADQHDSDDDGVVPERRRSLIEVRHPWVAVVLRLAQKHEPEALVELGMRLDRLGFLGRPGFLSVARWGPNRPEESAMRWLALSRADRDRYAHKDGDFLLAIWIVDMLNQLVLVALRTGEITLVEGPEAATDILELRDGRTLRAMRIEFREDLVEEAGSRTAQSAGPPIPKPTPPPAEPARDEVLTAMAEAGVRPGTTQRWDRTARQVHVACGVDYTVRTLQRRWKELKLP